jgi:drug/metabolite transporter (DMT)-like permease
MTTHPPARAGDRIMILVAAFLFSTGGAAIKACTITGWQVASLRSGIAAVTLLLFLPSARRGWSWRTWLVGSAYATTMITFVLGNKLTTAANQVFLQSAAPIYLLILGPVLLHEPVRRRQLWFLAVLAAGMWMILSGNQPISVTAPDPFRGNMIGLATGIAWALTIVGLRWLGREQSGDEVVGPAPTAVVCGNVIACIAALPGALPITDTTPTDWAIVAFLGVFQITLAYIFLLRGVRRVGALEVSLLVLLEPVLSPVWAWLVHGETPATIALLGGGIIIAATAIYTIVGERGAGSQVRRSKG